MGAYSSTWAQPTATDAPLPTDGGSGAATSKPATAPTKAIVIAIAVPLLGLCIAFLVWRCYFQRRRTGVPASAAWTEPPEHFGTPVNPRTLVNPGGSRYDETPNGFGNQSARMLEAGSMSPAIVHNHQAARGPYILHPPPAVRMPTYPATPYARSSISSSPASSPRQSLDRKRSDSLVKDPNYSLLYPNRPLSTDHSPPSYFSLGIDSYHSVPSGTSSTGPSSKRVRNPSSTSFGVLNGEHTTRGSRHPAEKARTPRRSMMKPPL